jgi:hypothetical protein
VPVERFVGLRADIQQELKNLDRLTSEARLLLVDVPKQPTFREIRAAGSILHDFYTAVERIFRRIAAEVDAGLPSGPDWHIQLLLRMAASMPDTRPPVISESLKDDLSEYLRFRHLFRHVYGFYLPACLVLRIGSSASLMTLTYSSNL